MVTTILPLNRTDLTQNDPHMINVVVLLHYFYMADTFDYNWVCTQSTNLNVSTSY